MISTCMPDHDYDDIDDYEDYDDYDDYDDDHDHDHDHDVDKLSNQSGSIVISTCMPVIVSLIMMMMT